MREMSNKRKSINPINTSTKQHQITGFVEKIGNFTKGNSRVTSTQSSPKEKCTKVTVAKGGVNNKRAMPDSASPEGLMPEQPTKKQLVDMSVENKERENNTTGTKSLNPELMELKRQLFEGFDALIDQKLSPLKKDIQALKSERKHDGSELNVETLTRKIKQSDAKHKKVK